MPRAGAHLPAHTLRFQTDGPSESFSYRLRGSTFSRPTASKSRGVGCEESTDDLMARCTCRKCHQELEDKASYFGAYIEQGSMSARELPRSFTGTGQRSKRASRLHGKLVTRA